MKDIIRIIRRNADTMPQDALGVVALLLILVGVASL